ncbi:hypothetical protein [Streptomyces sp. NRRL F-5193]|uniref:hypothetical protein n=1 Tax=Streptomyces sp. NRRL F-5193 TaxID=1463860 RepID=UPI0005BAA09A|nr:hypothetical protein [Streptomyces sp. NRRL F-5193]
MYQMRNVRLENTGHRDAGFKSLVVDLMGGTVLVDGRRVATAQDAVLWLRNGGGKSTLLALIFSLLLPHKFDFIGRAEGKSLADYVPGNQVSHVIIEWGDSGHPEAGPVLVTGGVYQWQGGQRPADLTANGERLDRRWYIFRPLSGVLEMGSLPVRNAEGQLSLTSYIKALEAAGKTHRRLDLVVATDQYRWAEQLASSGLDPELFKVQRDMNKDEGGITSLFAFKTCEDFADFLIDMVVDEAVPLAARSSLSKHADKLALRPDRELEGRFLAEAVLRLRPVQKATAGLAGAQGVLGRQVALARRACEHVNVRGGLLEREAGELAGSAVEAGQEAEAAAARGAELEREVAGLEEAVGRARVAERAETEERCRQKAAEAKSHSAGWKQVPQVLELSEHEEALRRVDRMLEELSVEQAPLREAMEAAGARLLTRLTGELEHLGKEVPRLRGVQADAQSEVEQADEARMAAAEAKGDARRRAEAAQARSEEIEQSVAAAREEGLLRDGESVQQATGRAAGEEAVAREEERAGKEQRERARVRRGELVAERRRCEKSLGEARRRHEEVWEELTAAFGERDALRAEPRLGELAGVEGQGLDLAAVGAELADLLEQQVEAADTAAAGERAQALEDRRVRDALERNGFCPAPREVEEAVAALRAAGVGGAMSGLEFLRDTVPARQHDEVLATAPHLIGGVVVCDPVPEADLAAVVRCAGLSPCGVVAVGTREQVTGLCGSEVRFTVMPVHPAVLDADAADRELERLNSRMEALDGRLRALIGQRDKDRALAARLRAHLSAFMPEAQAALEQRLGHLDEEVTELTARAQDLQAQAEAVEDEDWRATVRIDGSVKKLAAFATLMPRLRSLAASCDVLPGLVETVRQARGEEREQQRRLEELALRYQAAQGHAAGAADRVKECERLVVRRSGEAQQLRSVLPEDLVERAVRAEPPSTSLRTLGERWTQARQDWENGIGDEVLQERRAAEQQQVARLNRDLDRDPEIRRLACALAEKADGADSERLQEQIGAAGAVEAAAVEAASEAAVLHRQAREAHQRACQAGERFVPALVPLVVGCVEEGEHRLEKAKAHLEQALVSERHCRLQETALGRKADRAAGDARLLAQIMSMLGSAAARHEITADKAGAGEEPARDLTDAVLLESHGLSATTAMSMQPADAERVCGDITAAVEHAGREHTAALKALDRAVRAVERLAQDPQYLQVVDGRVRARLEQALSQPRRLGEFLEDIEDREREVTELLEEMAGDQAMVVGSCITMVKSVLDDLKEVARHSRLPQGLGSWSGRHFLSFEVRHWPREEELERRLGKEIDNMVAALPAGKGDSASALPEAMPLAKRLVLAALGGRGNIVAKIIKPAQNLDSVEQESVTKIRTFSGGEKLTVSVLLYCTLARMRAAQRDRRIPGGIGTLIMDNPFGKANYGPFIALQRRVATAQGIQLVYATGINDLPVLGRFPLIIRLRNGLDLRTRRRYVQVTDRYGDAVARAAEQAGGDGIATARLLRRGNTGQDATEPGSEGGEAV